MGALKTGSLGSLLLAQFVAARESAALRPLDPCKIESLSLTRRTTTRYKMPRAGRILT